MLLVSSLPAVGEDFYISQSGDGDNTNNMTWFNSAANWGAGVGKVSAGDNVYFIGTFTSQCRIPGGGGTVGSRITLGFTNANWSRTNFYYDVYDTEQSAIYGGGISNINLNGGGCIILATDNGLGLGNRAVNHGIQINGLFNGMVQGFVITNLLNDPDEQWNDMPICDGIWIYGGSDYTVQSNKTYRSSTGIMILYEAGNHDIIVQGNTMWYNNWGIGVGAVGNNTITTNITLRGNYVDKQYVSYDAADNNHRNGIHFYDETTGSSVIGLVIERNYFGPDNGRDHSTADIFIDLTSSVTQVVNMVIVNNMLLCGPAQSVTNPPPWANGWTAINAARCSGVSWIANNTIVGVSGTTANAINNTAFSGTLHIKNNLVLNFTYGVLDWGYPTANLYSDYNVFCRTNIKMAMMGPEYDALPIDTWIAGGQDPNSATNYPTMNASFVPLTNDTIAVGTGTNLSAVFTTDFNGVTRPAEGAWTIGAYQVAAEETPPAAPAPSTGARTSVQTLIFR